MATGSLGQGLPYGVGIALAGKRLDRLPYRIWVLCGDSEMAEGSMWEAFEHAWHEKLDNLIAIIDVNRLGQRGETMHGWDLDSYAKRAEAFGWHAIEIDGHDVEAIDAAYAEALETTGMPTVIVAKTIKGKGVKAVENKDGFHGKALDDPEAAIEELGGIRNITIDVAKPEFDGEPHRFEHGDARAAVVRGRRRRSRRARRTATRSRRSATGAGTSSRSTARSRTRRSPRSSATRTRTATSRCTSPSSRWSRRRSGSRCAAGSRSPRRSPRSSTRAYDFVRMAAISRANLKLVGSHAGVSIGEDGPSQMALEDLAAFRAVHGSTVLYPSDANQTAKLVEAMADLDGIVFLRTTRANTPVIYEAGRGVPGRREPRSCAPRTSDDVALIGAGITLHEALKAADALAEEGVGARVIDLYSVKPVDVETLRAAAEATGGRFVVAEDHWPEGGLAEAVLSAFADSDERPRVVHLAVREMPGSGNSGRAARGGRDRRRAHRRSGTRARREHCRRNDLTRAALDPVHPHPGGEEEFHPPPATSVSAERARV